MATAPNAAMTLSFQTGHHGRGIGESRRAMERQSQHAGKFIRELSELAERLAARDIVVGWLHAEYSHFGCWQLIARKHHEAVRFFWDGRDGYITVESSPIRDSSAPNEWKQETAKGFDRVSGDDPLRFVEDYLTTRFPV